jgi:hypothetical protein
VDDVDQFFVLRAVRDPDGVEIDILREGAEVRKDIDDLRRVRGHLGFADGGSELWRRIEVERERDVLREIEARIREVVITDVAAESVAVISRLGRSGGEGLIDLFANLLADRSGGIEVGVVAACVESGGEVEERLAGLEGDGGAASLRLGDSGARRERLLLVLESGVGLRTGRGTGGGLRVQ